MGGRGVAPVLGLALLLGFVIAGALAVFAVGVTVVDSSQDQTETAQAEQSMLAAAESADALATGDRQSADFSFEGAGDGVTDVDETAGRLNITQYVDGEAETVILDDAELGAFRFERDNTEFAYQAGAVWRLDDVGDPVLIRAPELHYTGQTLTFPFVTVTGDATDGQQTGVMEVSETEAVYPDAPTDFNPLRNGTVKLEVESRYCAGWEEYFVQQTEGAIVESCGETGDTSDDELLVELVVPFEMSGTEESILAAEFENEENINGTFDEVEEINMPSPSGLIESKIEQATDEGEHLSTDPGTVDEGLYYADEMSGGYEFDTSNGDVEVAVDGPVFEDIDQDDYIDIEDDGTVTIFAADEVLNDATGGGDTYFGNESDTNQLRLLVHSDVDEVGGDTNDELYAFIYAPNSHVDFGQASSIEFEGGVVADKFSVDNGNPGITANPLAKETELEYEFGGRSIYYLHVTRTEIEFSGEP